MHEDDEAVQNELSVNRNDVESGAQRRNNNYGAVDENGCIRAAYQKCTVGVNFKDDDGHASISARQRLFTRVITIAVVLIVMTPLAYFSYNANGGSNTAQTGSNFELEEVVSLEEEPVILEEAKTTIVSAVHSSTVALACSNEYGTTAFRSTNILKYPFLETVAANIEPYKSHTCLVSFDSTWDGVKSVTYSLVSDKSGIEYASGSSVVKTDTTTSEITATLSDVRVEAAGKATLMFTSADADAPEGTVVQTAEAKLSLKYVKREIDTLTAEDRELMLDTMHVLWSTDTESGVKLYGNDYKSVYYFAQLHCEAPIYPGCDMFHTGPGFLHQHVYLEAYFEQSMRAVNPAVTLHYVDYGKIFNSTDFQNHRSYARDGGNYTKLMTDLWFGSSDPVTGQIQDGRWAGAEVPRITTEMLKKEGIPDELFWNDGGQFAEMYGANHYASPLGYQRASWSMMSDRKVLRFNNYGYYEDYLNEMAPGDWANREGVNCDGYTSYVTAAVNSSYETISQLLEFDAHGPAHFAFAGGTVYEENDNFFKEEFNFTEADILNVYWIHHHMMKYSSFLQFTNQTEVLREHKNITVTWKCDMPILEASFDELALIDFEALGPTGNITCEAQVPDGQTDKDFILEWFNGLNAGENPDLDSTTPKILGFTDTQFKRMVELFGQRITIEGDLSTAGAAIDPVFWVLHGGVEKLYQRFIFEGLVGQENRFVNDIAGCPGHSASGKNPWMKGFHFSKWGDSSEIATEHLTNAELVSYLDPTREDFLDKFDFIYVDATYDWCASMNDVIAVKTAGLTWDVFNSTQLDTTAGMMR